ncbi:MAG: putative nucleotide-diphospho-sugar transferase [Hyphomicrobiaceae bacterium]|nr:putative nucleotide-diphospho-sugar transferase [Hyphomicrobiaceae bacterium]
MKTESGDAKSEHRVRLDPGDINRRQEGLLRSGEQRPSSSQCSIELNTRRERALMSSYVVCGWYTPDYAGWANDLRQSLLRHGQPFELVRVESHPGEGWEATTMRKAREVLKSLDRHAGKTIIFIDVDCEVAGDLAPLTQLRGDVAFYVHPRRRRSGHTKAHIRSGTIVLKPTPEARRFVERWVDISDRPEYGDVDQDALLLSINTPGVLFEQLDVKWCYTKSDKCNGPLIIHGSASKNVAKIGTTRRRLVALANRLFRDRASRSEGSRFANRARLKAGLGEPAE